MDNFILKFLWLEKSIAVSLDQCVLEKTTPLTEYYFWPQRDAWEEMKNFLESKPWISQSTAILLLNQITEVINFWQDKDNINRKDISKVKERFPKCLFVGYD
jgi:30S ribosomal protein 3